tara:strand:- start:15646 stop:18687 length:3042 start_codon:yes stop_codon:yes gene_type:complete
MGMTADSAGNGTNSNPAETIASLCRRLQGLLDSGRTARIEDLLLEVPTFRTDALIELLKVERRFLIHQGELPGIESYLTRFPGDRYAVQAAFGMQDGEHGSEDPSLIDTDRSSTISELKPFGSQLKSTRDRMMHPADEQTVTQHDFNLGIASDEFSVSEGDDDFPWADRFQIEGRVGQGGFGQVLRAFDTELLRSVAIKGPRPERWAKLVKRLGPHRIEEAIDDFRREARQAARLKHEFLVRVLDFQVVEGKPYIIQEFVEGADLRGWAKSEPRDFEMIARMVLKISQGLQHAHRNHVAHRDIKPANILVDEFGDPHITDFGLAWHESFRESQNGIVSGTLPYMSPEQLEGIAVRQDGRTDLWSVGVVLYELLTGRRPFEGDRKSLRRQILSVTPPPPRQHRPDVPEALEQICLRLLRPCLDERYSAAEGLIEDLTEYLAPSADGSPPELEVATAGRPPIVVPKGLRSFDEHDAEFFLTLLPGPVDENGLPESLRFWKGRIEEPQSGLSFELGMICGPSGSGKSSLIRAGLVPRLSPTVIPLYVACESDCTESRIVRALASQFPAISADAPLVEAFEQLMDVLALARESKVLLVLDQFEQWMHGKDASKPHVLTEALQRCDASKLQCILLTRDDFRIAADRVFQHTDHRFVLGRNLVYVDPFARVHARKVLYEFGKAYEKLPIDGAALTRRQNNFLDESVSYLIDDGGAAPIRLALFADLIKDKPWEVKTLRQFGGAAGLGIAFLNATFHSKNAPSSYRYHRRAAQNVLRALLPEPGVEIRSAAMPINSIREVSGYGREPQKFDDLLTILEKEVRLVTAAETHADELTTDNVMGLDGRHYQLTHDFLIPAIRSWLLQRQTPLSRFRKFCEDPSRIPQAAGMTLFIATMFVVFHTFLLVTGGIGSSQVSTIAMFTWITLFDIPYIVQGIQLLRGRHGVIRSLLACDFFVVGMSALTIWSPETFYIDLFGSVDEPGSIRARYTVILLFLTYCSSVHLVAWTAIRAARARRQLKAV